MRCNTCSRLLIAGNVEGDNCVCGSRAWFFSRVTLIERLLFLLGVYRDTDLPEAMRMSRKPIGGRSDLINEQWAKGPAGGS